MKGYLAYEDERSWYFIPVKSMDTIECVRNFEKGNFRSAIRFNAPQSTYLLENFDTLKIDGTKDSTLKVMPVKMEYIVTGGNDLRFARTFKRRLAGADIEFEYALATISIKKITPLFCYNRKKSDVRICECKKNADDENDYLYKICSHLKSKGDISFQPCKYKVTEISESIYDGKKAIKVNLNCCYFGDRAYFDPQTKELIAFAYGAK